ncbi:MAG: APC family permease [Acidobacteriota bacterium]
MAEANEQRTTAEKDTMLARRLGLPGLVATGICSMIGAAIYVIPVVIQRNVPDIGPNVLFAYLLGAVPAIVAALAYAILASAMPRAGGSYIFASRAFHPFLGFIASFSQWFGLCIAIGVVSYLLIPFLRDIAAALELPGLADTLAAGPVRVTLALLFLWFFTGVNLLGVKLYERTLVPLMLLMFVGGAMVIVSGFSFDHADFVAAVARREGVAVPLPGSVPLQVGKLLAASAILFGSFIGFDSIAQAGGEARNPNRTLPLAIGISVTTVGTFYILFTAAIYHAVPWNFMAERAMTTDLTAPGLLGYLLSPGWTVAIVAGAAIALINDLPAMILAVSRLMFAWAADGLFPASIAKVNHRWQTPHIAILLSSLMASGGIIGSHLAGDFFLGVDILITSMLVNFLLMCLCVLMLPHRNPRLAGEVRFVRNRRIQVLIGLAGTLILSVLLVVHIAKDLTSQVSDWYFHSTPMWLVVMSLASLVFLRKWRQLQRTGAAVEETFLALPPG